MQSFPILDAIITSCPPEGAMPFGKQNTKGEMPSLSTVLWKIGP